MALFVEVNSLEKSCPVIVNLEHIVEIAPLVEGGCVLFMNDGAGMNSSRGVRVSDNYELFKQFAMQTVTADDIARRFPKPTDKPLGEAREFKVREELKNISDDLEIPTMGKPATKATKK